MQSMNIFFKDKFDIASQYYLWKLKKVMLPNHKEQDTKKLDG